MNINTRDFGEISVSESELITFPSGIFAFEDVNEFALISPLGEDVYPKWLQSTADKAPCFILFDPVVVDEKYKVDIEALEPFEVKTLKLDGDETDNNIKTLVIATVGRDFKDTTINLKAPIVINTKKRLAIQVILSLEYDFKFPLYSKNAESFEDNGEKAGGK